MADANSTSITPLEAEDTLNHAHSMITFLQDVLSLTEEGALPENLNTTGLYYIFEDIKSRIINANSVFSSYVKADTISASHDS